MIRKILVLALCAMLVLPAAASAESSGGDEGPVLVAQLPEDVSYLGTDESDGGYTEHLATADGMASIAMARRAGQLGAADVLKALYPDALDVAQAEQSPIASYPATRLTFRTGENEDAREGVLVCFSTDTDTFFMAVDAAADAWEGETGYKALADAWFETLDVFDGLASDDAAQWADQDGAAPIGLMLTAALPDDAKTDGPELLDDGGYIQMYFIDDSLAVVTVMRAAEDMTAEELLDRLYPEAADIQPGDQAPVASYPAERLTFAAGEGEDATKGVLVAVHTDAGAFAFVAEIDADSFGDYAAKVEEWIASIDFADSGAD